MMNSIYGFDPQKIHIHIAQKDWVSSWNYLILTLSKMQGFDTHVDIRKNLEKDFDTPETKEKFFEFSKLMSELLLILLNDDAVPLEDDVFYQLIFHHESIHTLFYIAGFHETDPLIEKLLEEAEKKLTPEKQKKMLVLLSLETKFDIVQILGKALRKYHLPAAIVYLSHLKMFSIESQENKIKLFPIVRKIEQMPINRAIVKHIVKAFFQVSYINYPNKHDVKRYMNRYIQRLNKKFVKGIEKPKPPQGTGQTGNKKPRLLCYPEVYFPEHALYRSWNRRLIEFKERFDVEILIKDVEYDSDLLNYFDTIHTFSTENMHDAFQQIHNINADIMFYPSIGLTGFGLMFSNHRFCPLQVMGLGHPATAMNPNIDFVLGHEGLYTQEAFPQDRYILDQMPPIHNPHKSLKNLDFSIPEKSDPKNTMKIGVVGTTIKFSASFFQLLHDIIDEADFDIHLVFYFLCTGLDYIYIKNYLQENFENYTLYGAQEYGAYLKSLKEVDIVFNPFPFGHSNTITDTLLMGKPCISLQGIQPHSRVESVIFHELGFGDQFVVNSLDEYKARFFEFSKQIMAGNTYFFDPVEIYNKICEKKPDYDYAGVLEWLYQNQKSLKAQGYGAFTPAQNTKGKS